MRPGDIIEAETFDHKFINCRLVEVRGKTAHVCGEQEWQKATSEEREPVCLGWPLTHVRELKNNAIADAA